MDNQCSKFEEKLSAYLDGQLPADEMAEVAAHLDDCSVCSVLLDKMRKLEDMAREMVPEFDDAVLDELTDRITAGLEEIEPAAEKPVERKPQVFPVWYRYASVAASVVIVFFVGRMAFIETEPDLKRHRLPGTSFQMSKPAMDLAPGSQSKAEKPTVKTETKELGELQFEPAPSMREKEAEDRGGEVDPKREAAADDAVIGIPKPVFEAEVVKTPVMNEFAGKSRSKKGAPDQAVELKERDELTAEVVPSKIMGKITDQETGEPLPGVAVQLEGTTIGALSDSEGEFEIMSVPPDTYNLVFSTTDHGTVTVKDVSVARDEITRQQVEMQPMVIAASEISTDAESGDAFDYEKAGKESIALLEDEELLSFPLTVDSLEAIYSAAIGVTAISDMAYFGHDAKTSAPKGRLIPNQLVRALLDSVESIPETEKSYRRIESLYLRARANYDLYRQTRDREYLDSATELKSALQNLVEEYLEREEDNELLLDYKDKIENWKF